MTASIDSWRQDEEQADDQLALVDLDVTPDQVEGVTGGTRGGGCDDEFGCGTNHNETLALTPEDDPAETPALDDLELTDEQAAGVVGGRLARNVTGAARSGGCDEWGCGTNHNEVLVFTA
jgi:hypothetical protein